MCESREHRLHRAPFKSMVQAMRCGTES